MLKLKQDAYPTAISTGSRWVAPETRPVAVAKNAGDNYRTKSMSKSGGGADTTSWSEWNPANFEQVVSTYQTRIYRFIYGMVGEAELSADLTQDTFLSAYRNLSRRAEDPQFNPADPQNNMQAWLYTIARNAVLSEMRRRKIVRFLPFAHRTSNNEEEIDGIADVVQIEAGGNMEIRATLHDELQRAMDVVGRERLTALLLYIDGFSYKEICDVTGDSLSSVKSQIFRAKDSLRRALRTEAGNDSAEGGLA